MSIFEKLDDLEKACCQIKKEEVGGMIFLSDKMLQHILDVTDDNYTKLQWIRKIIDSMKKSGADEQELITMSNSIGDMSVNMFNENDDPF
tara:strand:- start:557 stop:826 length:270 start_codon:yes stop_codon:yes gene_type:complete